MNFARLPSVLLRLVLPVAAIAVATFCNWVFGSNNNLEFRQGVAIVVVMSQVALAALWLVCGNGYLLFRMFVVVVLMELILRQIHPSVATVTEIVTCLVVVVVGVIANLSIRTWKSARQNTSLHMSTSQFSLKQLLQAVTCIAILIAFIRLHRGALHLDFSRNPVRYIATSTVFATLALLGMWSSLGSSTHVLARLIVPPSIAILIATLLSLVGGDILMIATVLVLQELLVALPLAIYRRWYASLGLKNDLQATRMAQSLPEQ